MVATRSTDVDGGTPAVDGDGNALHTDANKPSITLVDEAPDCPTLQGNRDEDWIKLEREYLIYKEKCSKKQIQPKTIDNCITGKLKRIFRLGILNKNYNEMSITAEEVEAEIDRAKKHFPKQREAELMNTLQLNYNIQVDDATRRVAEIKAELQDHLILHQREDLWDITDISKGKQTRKVMVEKICKSVKPASLQRNIFGYLHTTKDDTRYNHIKVFEYIRQQAEKWDEVHRSSEKHGVSKDYQVRYLSREERGKGQNKVILTKKGNC